MATKAPTQGDRIKTLEGEVTQLQTDLNALRAQCKTLLVARTEVKPAAQPAKPARANAPTKGEVMSVKGVRCGKCSKGKVEVKHPSVADVKACYGV